ncbi:MAG: glycosyltransferase [Tannerellaceae bacterium]|jgi:glycosyltransferase involved in cell wall biosynthesis|nr:glycosyltransferase [Tannerellaceae bacterium]
MQPFVSVIVPVYNVEPFFERCLHALFGQTLYEMEYVFINDCTPDNSMSLLNQVLMDYPQRREQVRIINHEHNMGLAVTRKEGMKAATGEYVISCDSDDWAELTMYEKMYAAAVKEHADLVCCQYYEEFGNNKRILKGQKMEHKTSMRKLNGGFFTVWNKLVRRSLYTNYDVYPYEGVNMGEDVYVGIRLCHLSKKTTVIPEPLYHYNRQNVTAMTAGSRRLSLASVPDMVLGARKLETFFQEHGAYDENEVLIQQAKFDAKLPLLLHGRDQEWLNLFPETHRYIWKYPEKPIPRRIFYTLASNGIFLPQTLRRWILRLLT